MKFPRVHVGRLEVVALVTGFVLMVFELAGARVLAPWIGSSTYIWTSVIGVIVAALSLGYWTGGKLADRRGYAIDVVRLLLLTSLAIGLTLVQYNKTLLWVAGSFDDSRIQGVIASLLLFAPASFLLGVISPYLVKLNVRSLATTGRSVASLSALNSIGGIIGTFSAGFILFGLIGSHETMALLTIMIMASSWLLVSKIDRRRRITVSIGILCAVLLSVPPVNSIEIDTPSARYTINNLTSGERLLSTGPSAAQSGIVVDKPNELLFWYTQRLAEAIAAAPKKDDILILGGGVFTLPRHLAEKYPNAAIDVVEIDPGLEDIARNYFAYNDPPNINLIFQDARVYLNQSQKKYDVVLVDAYGDLQVPFTFLTREYGDALARAVRPEGIVGVNMIAGMKDGCREMLVALDAPYRMHFDEASYRINHKDYFRTNIVAVYSRMSFVWSRAEPLVLPLKSPYTDNFVPSDQLYGKCLNIVNT